MYGDSKGEVNMVLCGTREWPARDMVSTDEHQDYLTVHKEHTDWISQVRGGCLSMSCILCGEIGYNFGS